MNTLEYATKMKKNEALTLTQNLVTLTIAHFGENARKWFTLRAIKTSQSVQYDPETRKLIENNQCDYSHLIKDARYCMSDAEYKSLVNSGETDLLQERLARYQEEASDSDEEENAEILDDVNIQEYQEECVFKLDALFNLDPPVQRMGPHNCSQSIGTMATGTSIYSHVHAQENTERQTGEESDG